MVESIRFQSILSRVRSLLRNDDFPALRLLLADFQAPDIAASFENFDQEEQLKILRNLDVEKAVDIFAFLELEHQLDLMNEFRQERAVRFLEEMSPDDRTDLIQSLPEEVAKQLFEQLPNEEKEEVRELIQYDPQSAGGIMTPEFMRVPPEITLSEALETLRRDYRDLEMSYYLYVLDDEDHVLGVISLHNLMLNPPDVTVESIMLPHPLTVTHDIDQEVVARQMVDYDLIAMPVVDFKDRMLGIVTFDDVAEVLEDEATEDQERFGALLHAEESYERSNTWALMKQRLPWLVILLLLSSVAVYIVEWFEASHQSYFSSLELFTTLVIFIPMITATAGNAGIQAATIMVRGLATGEIDYRSIGRVAYKELMVGLSMGAALAAIAFLRVYIFNHSTDSLQISVIMFASILLILVISTVFGSVLPLLVGRFGLDPATISSPLITTTIDILTVVIYFGVAIMLEGWFSL